MNYEQSWESQEAPEAQKEIELPSSVELLDRPGKLPEKTYISEFREETRDAGKAEALEQPEQSPYRYSEAYIDEKGKYHPQQITGIYKDALENSGGREMAGELSCWGRQERKTSCNVRVEQMIINEGRETKVSEASLREISGRNNWYGDNRGTYIKDIGKIAENYYGMERKQYEGISVDDLKDLKQQGAELIVAVDQALLARPYLSRPTSPNHAIEVIGFDDSDLEHPKVIINDPGRRDGRGAAYPLEVFERASCTEKQENGEPGLHSVTALYRKEAAV